MYNETIEILESIKAENDKIYMFGIHNEYRPFYFIGNDNDISSSLEYTLHELIDNDYEEYVYQIMGAYIPDEDEITELEEYDEYTNIDLGYVIGGLITTVNEI